MSRLDSVAGTEVHKRGDNKRRGVIVEPTRVLVRWEDGSVTEEHLYELTDVATKRRAARKAAERWA